MHSRCKPCLKQSMEFSIQGQLQSSTNRYVRRIVWNNIEDCVHDQHQDTDAHHQRATRFEACFQSASQGRDCRLLETFARGTLLCVSARSHWGVGRITRQRCVEIILSCKFIPWRHLKMGCVSRDQHEPHVYGR